MSASALTDGVGDTALGICHFGCLPQFMAWVDEARVLADDVLRAGWLVVVMISGSLMAATVSVMSTIMLPGHGCTTLMLRPGCLPAGSGLPQPPLGNARHTLPGAAGQRGQWSWTAD